MFFNGLISGLVVGILFGVVITSIAIGVYGDPDTNEQIANMRKVRVQMHKAKLELALTKFIRKNKGVQFTINDKGESK